VCILIFVRELPGHTGGTRGNHKFRSGRSEHFRQALDSAVTLVPGRAWFVQHFTISVALAEMIMDLIRELLRAVVTSSKRSGFYCSGSKRVGTIRSDGPHSSPLETPITTIPAVV
jgi:hypothetical protein